MVSAFFKPLNGSRQLATLVLAALALAAIVGFAQAMPMGGGIAMATCPFAQDGMSLCPFSLADHVSSWRTTFAADFANGFGWLMLMSLALLSGAALLLVVNIGYNKAAALYRYGSLAPPYIREALARGIIHPKRYA